MFLNEFYYEVLENVPLVKDKEIMRDFLKLNFTDYEENYDSAKV